MQPRSDTQTTAAVTPVVKEAETGGGLDAFDIFNVCIERAKNLVKIHQVVHGGKGARPEKHLSDLHRAAIVLAVSALDAYVRIFILSRIRRLVADRSTVLPPPLADKIKQFLKDDALLDAARRDDLLERVDKAFTRDYEKRSFQGTEAISSGLQLIGISDVFKDVATSAGKNEGSLCADIDKFTMRRHAIAHRGDYDTTQNPPKETPVTKKDATDCIELMVLVATHINAL